MHLGDTKQQTSHLSAECVLQLTSYSEPDMVRILTNPFCHINKTTSQFLSSLRLKCCTHINVCELVPLRREVEHDAVHVSGQRGGPDQQDHQDQVGEQGGEVDQL